MKTFRFISAIIVLGVIPQVLFAAPDGSSSRNPEVKLPLMMKDLMPQVPKEASFDMTEKELVTILLTDVDQKVKPVPPLEAGFDEPSVFPPDLRPEVPLEAPYSETL